MLKSNKNNFRKERQGDSIELNCFVQLLTCGLGHEVEKKLFPFMSGRKNAYDRDFEYSSGGDDTLTPSQLKNTPLDLGETSPQSQDIPPQTLIIEAQIIQNEAAENPKSTKPEQNTASSKPPLDEKTAGIIEKSKNKPN
ncbi:hypothetical protein JTB14_033252 [Gonioctena quinquepunctata]|nr:hypothetical protein JTB14_033252 [Gonioctena quinquepunctata]